MNLHQLTIASQNIRSLGQGVYGVHRTQEERIKGLPCKSESSASNNSVARTSLSLWRLYNTDSPIRLQRGDKSLEHRYLLCPWREIESWHRNHYRKANSALHSRQSGPRWRTGPIFLFHADDRRIGILNVYAQNQTGKRARLWQRLSEYQFAEAHWIISGDFNMTEFEEDRSPNYLEKAMGNREQTAWSSLALHLGVNDVFYTDDFRKIGMKRATWSKQWPIPNDLVWIAFTSVTRYKNVVVVTGSGNLWLIFRIMQEFFYKFT